MSKSNTIQSTAPPSLATIGPRIEDLEKAIRKLYKSTKDHLPFHGWHHIYFVRTKAVQFANDRRADSHH